MDVLKLRLITMGCILIVLGSALGLVRGFSIALEGLAVVGVVLLAAGLLMKSKTREPVPKPQ